MARSHATIYGTAWATESQFRTLPSDVQLLYIALLAQPDLNLCGVMPYIPQRWVRFAPDFTDAAKVETLVSALELRGYVVTDQETVELWVRSFMYHDRVFAQPQVAMAAASAFEAVQSPTLRHHITQAVPPELRQTWPDCLRGIKRDQARSLLEGCDAASWKPPTSPNASPSTRGDLLGVTPALAEGSGSGLGSGSGFQVSGLRDPASTNSPHETSTREGRSA
jgi:hypothetical protein